MRKQGNIRAGMAVWICLALSGPCFSLPQISSTGVSQARIPSAALDGIWAGVLQVDEISLHLVLHIVRAGDGSLRATVDSPDQKIYAIEATSVTRKEMVLTFTVSSVGATYAGKISADHQSIGGNWSQAGTVLPLVFHKEASNTARKAEEGVSGVEGTWQGALESKGMRLRFQLRVSLDEQKQLIVSLDNLDQNLRNLNATKVSLKGNSFHFEIPGIPGLYDGTLNSSKNALSGNWTQNGVMQSLDFKRSDQVLELRRPQNPVKPYSYSEAEITFSNTNAKISLAGTLTLPHGTGPFPAALLIAGSGPQDRDESIAGHKPFWVLADYLTRRGIAVLRYDKRGVGKSGGDVSQATTEDYASDAEAAVEYLKARKEIDAKRIGLIGHSEGGLIAPLVAARKSEIAWIVLLSAPGLTGEDTLLLQSQWIARSGGMGETSVQQSIDFDKKAYEIVRTEKDNTALEKKLTDLVQSTNAASSISAETLRAQFEMMSSPWFRYFLSYDPMPALEKVQCPVLALGGEKDLQVPPAEHMPAIGDALKQGENKDFEGIVIPGLNHLFQHAQTGAPREYGAIEETMAPEALTAISNWILKHNVVKKNESISKMQP